MAMTPEQQTRAEAALAANPEIGRRKLIAACGCTNYAAAKFLKLRSVGTQVLEANAKLMAFAETKTVAETARAPGPRSVMLKEDTRVLDRRPPASVRNRFYGLVKGRAYPVNELARDWGISAETLKRHARDVECFKYVDTTGHDDWEACVMHPETAAQFCGN